MGNRGKTTPASAGAGTNAHQPRFARSLSRRRQVWNRLRCGARDENPTCLVTETTQLPSTPPREQDVLRSGASEWRNAGVREALQQPIDPKSGALREQLSAAKCEGSEAEG